MSSPAKRSPGEVADALEAASKKLAALAENVRSGKVSLESDIQGRTEAIKTAKSALAAVQLPTDGFIDFMVSLCDLMVSRLFMKWKVFENIPNDQPISYKDLAAKVDAEPALIMRFAWMLVATGILKQVDGDKVAHTPRSRMYSTLNPLSATIQLGFDHHLKTFAALPDYFDKYGLKEPVGLRHTALAFTLGSPELTMWEVIGQTQEHMQMFNMAMAGFEATIPALPGYSVDWIAEKAKEDPDRILVVDVGGGNGQALKAIRNATPGLPATRYALEDLPEVIESAKQRKDPDLEGITWVGMNFHKEQPIKGALVYYIRRCLHDYGDADCVDILKQISGAMASDSKLLIVEQVLSNPPAPFAAGTNIMMATIGGKERTREDFEAILGVSGLKIEKISHIEGNPTSACVIQCIKG